MASKQSEYNPRILATQIVLFFVAVALFFIGLGVGLILNPTLGSALWILAGVIFVANVVWLVYSLTKKQKV